MVTDVEKWAIRSIQYWLDGKVYYPANFTDFFLRWMLFNSYCNKYHAGDKQGVIEFAKDHGANIWIKPDIQNIAVRLANSECVGNGTNDVPPHSEVKFAHEYLQHTFGIDHQEICRQVCRESKQGACLSIVSKDFSPPVTSPMALYRIVYQVRCNLFHGDKVDLDGWQLDRDEFLVSCGTFLMDVTLRYISTLPLV
jgi:hypothetical protein